MKLPVVKNLTVTGVLAKAAGVAGLGMVAYDAHTSGQIEAPRSQKSLKADNLTEHYLNDMKLESPSKVQSEMKKRIFNFYADENISSFFSNIGGYVKGLSTSVVQNVIPLGLSVGAIFTKGLLSKGFGIGLAAYGGIFLLQEAFGIGKSHK